MDEPHQSEQKKAVEWDPTATKVFRHASRASIENRTCTFQDRFDVFLADTLLAHRVVECHGFGSVLQHGDFRIVVDVEPIAIAGDRERDVLELVFFRERCHFFRVFIGSLTEKVEYHGGASFSVFDHKLVKLFGQTGQFVVWRPGEDEDNRASAQLSRIAQRSAGLNAVINSRAFR